MGVGSSDCIGFVYLHQRDQREEVSQPPQGSECGSQSYEPNGIPCGNFV